MSLGMSFVLHKNKKKSKDRPEKLFKNLSDQSILKLDNGMKKISGYRTRV